MKTFKGKDDFATCNVTSWDDFRRTIGDLKQEGHAQWIFRGQAQDWQLSTSLERALDAWEIDQRKRAGIELEMMREFRRRYKGADHNHVREDKLYCLALMQHHGAPTRLLDCTYSPYVAAQNAVKDGARPDGSPHVVWCFYARWLEDEAAKRIGKPIIENRKYDTYRSDKSFDILYHIPRPRKFVLHENPFRLNERLSIQQGIFLCPGSLEVSFLHNLKRMSGYKSPSNIIKLKLELTRKTRVKFAQEFKLMNISSAALFPGLDGFSRSLGEHLFHFEVMSSIERKS